MVTFIFEGIKDHTSTTLYVCAYSNRKNSPISLHTRLNLVVYACHLCNFILYNSIFIHRNSSRNYYIRLQSLTFFDSPVLEIGGLFKFNWINSRQIVINEICRNLYCIAITIKWIFLELYRIRKSAEVGRN